MHFVLFYHSLVSDWNHGNAHFLRGIATELLDRGHAVTVYEPKNGWSYRNLVSEHGMKAVRGFKRAYPHLSSILYEPEMLDLDKALRGSDVVIVHEWNDHDLVKRIGAHRSRRGNYVLFFHDTHHRSVTDKASMEAYDLVSYDGVLAFGNVIRNLYLKNKWCRKAWTWHEAADTRVFRKRPCARMEGDLVWVGNWGDDERTAELDEFLITPVRRLGLRCRVYGVRYPPDALRALAKAGIEYGGWLPNYEAPKVFSKFRMTVHIMRKPYVQSLPGIPTIRPFEAMACEIPLICSPWEDRERLFHPTRDFLCARDGSEMKRLMRVLLQDQTESSSLTQHAKQTILARHTCSHRVDELMSILKEVRCRKWTSRVYAQAI